MATQSGNPSIHWHVLSIASHVIVDEFVAIRPPGENTITLRSANEVGKVQPARGVAFPTCAQREGGTQL